MRIRIRIRIRIRNPVQNIQQKSASFVKQELIDQYGNLEFQGVVSTVPFINCVCQNFKQLHISIFYLDADRGSAGGHSHQRILDLNQFPCTKTPSAIDYHDLHSSNKY
jgi:hypothetical protein